MHHSSVKTSDVFALNMISQNLTGYVPVKTPFDADGSWRLCYDVLTLAHGYGVRTGTVEVQRKKKSPDNFRIEIDYKLELLGGYLYHLCGEIDCVDQNPAHAAGWRFTSVSLDSNGNPVPYSSIQKKATIVGNSMTVEGSGMRRTISIGQPCLIGWMVPDWLQRAGKAGQETPFEFTFVDDFDQVKPEGKVIFDTQYNVCFDERTHEPCLLRCYVQTGRGVLPTTYCVDSFNRCLFIVSGIEAYILRP